MMMAKKEFVRPGIRGYISGWWLAYYVVMVVLVLALLSVFAYRAWSAPTAMQLAQTRECVNLTAKASLGQDVKVPAECPAMIEQFSSYVK